MFMTKHLPTTKAGKLDTVTNKEKTLTMEVTKAPAGVTVQPTRTIEKTWPTQQIWTLIWKLLKEINSKQKKQSNAKLNELAVLQLKNL